MTRVLCCGGRDFADAAMVADVLANVAVTLLIEGGARGADRLARDWAQARSIETWTYTANWGQHGRAAGLIRNQVMLEDGKPDLVVAFPGGRGTADMVARAKKAGVPVWEYT